jgi:predicted PurR-regulated permease PerM
MPHARRRNIRVRDLASPVKATGQIYGDRLNLAVRICWLIVLAGVILYFGYHMLGRVKTLTTVVIGAIFFAYLIFPVVKRLNARMPLGAAIAVVYLSLVLLLAFALYTVVPAISLDVTQLAHNMPSLVAKMQNAMAHPQTPLLRSIPSPIRHYAAVLPATLEANIGMYASKFATTVLPVLVSFVAVGALFVVIPVVAAYMLLEAETMKRTVLGFFPEHRQPKALALITDLDRVVGGFLRGQIIVAVIIGVLVTVLLLVLHIDYAFLIGAVAGVLDVIPYVGAIAGWLPAFLIALFTKDFESALLVTIGIVVINQLEGHIIAPNVVSKSVELTPLAVILALIAGGEMAGIPGLLLAVPVAGAIRVLIIHFRPTPVDVADAPVVLSKNSHRPLLLRLISYIRERTRKS